VDELRFFDANCQIGRYNFRRDGTPYTLASLINDMITQGIAQRLAFDALAREHNPMLGNRRLMEQIQDAPDLAPCWAIGTWTTGESAEPDEWLRQLQANHVRTVRYFRHYYQVSPAEWSLGSLWRVLEDHRIPLFYDASERFAAMDPFDAEELYQLCHAHPQLPVILVKHRLRFNRQVYQLMAACPNLHLELSGYWHHRAVEAICTRFGEQRLLFGTNWPYMDSGFAIAAVTYARISNSARRAVAGENLLRLMEEVRW
jgi:uncharacterized protein